jgi:PKD repeat protein
MRWTVCLVVAVLLGWAPARGQTVSVSSACNPQGSEGVYAIGDQILFSYVDSPRVLPKGEVTVVPPCVSLTLRADVEGKPPLTLTWEGEGGFSASGNPVVVDTADLPLGEQSVVLTASNAYGEVTTAISLAVTKLEGIPRAPTADQSPSPDRTVTFTITAAGAYEWLWNFGDGTVTPWLAPQCAFETSTITHTYLLSGTYQVRATARNCRDGQRTSQPLSITVGGG